MHLAQALSQNRLFSAPSSSARGARARSKKAAAAVVRAEVGTGRGVCSFRFRALLLLLLLMMMMMMIILVKSYSHFIQSHVSSSRARRADSLFLSVHTRRRRANANNEQTTGGLEMVTLKSGNATAEVYTFGGVVTSFKKDNGREVLYVRPDAKFDKSKPISGGVPHCWPQFGPGDIQVHGFARNVDWELVSASEDTMTMKLTPSEYTKAMWDKEFEVVETVSIKNDALVCELAVTNKGPEPFTFTGSFHTYFAADIDAVEVKGLEGCESFDRLKEENGKVAAPITCTGPIDSLYKNAPSQIDLAVGGGNSVKITGAGWKDAVVWTPWTDMEACYKEFVCVENASCAEPVTVAAGATWTASTKLE